MTNYICNGNPQHTFTHPAKHTANTYAHQHLDGETLMEIHEEYQCPFCKTKDFSVAPELVQAVEGVYVADLTSGQNPTIDKLLAEGWVIVGRYAKQYTLEKPKVTQP